MARRQLIAGNWKMNGLLAESAALVETLLRLRGHDEFPADLMICPPATLLHPVAAQIKETPVILGAQDCAPEKRGAHTGDIAADMLADLGVSAVIVGHSERRRQRQEGDAVVRGKAEAALTAGLTPILCVGESEAERLSGQALAVVGQQLSLSMPRGEGCTRVVLAYEPVWAIGTGRTPRPDDVQQMHAHLRQLLTAMLGAAGSLMRILYGGSVKPVNAESFLGLPDVDGGLIGGASLNAQEFWSIALASRAVGA